MKKIIGFEEATAAQYNTVLYFMSILHPPAVGNGSTDFFILDFFLFFFEKTKESAEDSNNIPNVV